MKNKKDKFASITTTADALQKQKELVRQLVSFNISSDISTVQVEGGVVGLKRDLRSISRKVASLIQEGK